MSQFTQNAATRLLSAALSYARHQGWRVFPVDPVDGKRPKIAKWQEKATTNPEQIRTWWQAWPNANIGIATGERSGIWVLDVDVKDDKPGHESLSDLESTHGELPATMHAITGSGGSHYYFRCPEGTKVKNSADSIAPGLDVRGSGGFIVAPPSVHSCGRYYEWEIESADEVCDAPDWLLQLVERKRRRNADHLDVEPVYTDSTTDFGRAKLEAECLSFAARTSNRNHHLNLAAYHIGRYVAGGEIARQDAEQALWAAAMQQRDKGWTDGNAQIRSTIGSALDSGQANPYRQAPRIVMRGDNHAEVVDRAVQFLADHADDLYQRHGLLCTVHDTPTGRAIVDVKRGRLRHRLGQVIQWYKLVSNGDTVEQKRCNVPQDVVVMLHELQQFGPIRYLEGLAGSPVVTPSGEVKDEPGYDASTRTLYDPQGVRFPSVKAAPTKDDAHAAYNLLREILTDFPFAGELELAAAVSGIMTAVLRQSMRTAPLYLYDGNTPGSGKSLLAKLAMCIATGSSSQPTATNATNEELAKQVTGLLSAGQRFLLLDNIGHTQALGGPTLDALITSERWSQRLLGGNQVFSAPNTLMVMATGNNVRLAGDMLRRVICCYLDPQTERPDQRERFKYPDILRHAAAMRPQLVHAVLTLMRAHLASGRPSRQPTLGTFYDWSAWVREPILWVSDLDVASTQNRLRDSGDERLVAWRVFMQSWRSKWFAQAVSTSDAYSAVTTCVSEHDFAMRESLEHFTAKLSTRALGYIFRSWEGRIVGGLRLKKAGRGRKGTEWLVEQVQSQ